MGESRFKVEFTLPYYDGKWVGLSGSGSVGFNAIEQAQEQCEKMGPVYFTCGDEVTRWQQRIMDTETGQVVAYAHTFDGTENE